jgi:hypothetical protein
VKHFCHYFKENKGIQEITASNYISLVLGEKIQPLLCTSCNEALFLQQKFPSRNFLILFSKGFR